MSPPARLGGFKILKDVFWFSLSLPAESLEVPARLLRLLAGEKINLPYITCLNERSGWGVNMAVDATNGPRSLKILRDSLADPFHHAPGSAILSVFPHKNDPEITGALFGALGRGDLGTVAWANSPSALSVICLLYTSDAADE